MSGALRTALVVLLLAGGMASAEEPLVVAIPSWEERPRARLAPAGARLDSTRRTWRFGAAWKPRPEGRLYLGFEREDHTYATSGPAAGALPGGATLPARLHSTGLRAVYRRPLAGDRAFHASLRVRWDSEAPGTSDAANLLAFVGRTRRVSDDLRLGWGIVGLARPGEPERILPGFQVEWTPSERFRLLLQGPRFEAAYQIDEDHELALTARTDVRRYRLASGNGLPGGVLKDFRFPVQLALRRRVDGQTALSFFVGRDLNRRLEVRGAGGRDLGTVAVDDSVVVGFRVALPLSKLF